MRYHVWRGDEEIGGMCIEVSSADGTRILLDLGMPLTDENGDDYPFDTPQRPTAELLAEGILRDIPGLYPGRAEEPAIDAIVLTHAHLDHYGLAHHARPEIPVYGSLGTHAILDVARVFFPGAAQPADLRMLPEEPLKVGSLQVTAIPVDHAAPDSQALIVEGDGQKLVYSGDLRAHGRTGFRFENMLKDERLRDADWLLLEGTTLGPGAAEGHGLRSEQDVEKELVALAEESKDKLVAVVASGQNLDRLVSCFRAARKGGRILLIDPYQAFVLQKLAPLSTAIPQFSWDGVRVSFSPHQVERLREAREMDLVYEMARAGKASSEELRTNPGRYLVCARGSRGTTKLLSHVGPQKVEFVWSMWSGYWRRGRSVMAEWAEREGVRPHFIHSGGHAWPEDLRRLVDALRPRVLVWVHTEGAVRAMHSL